MNIFKLMSWFNPGRWALYLTLGLSLWLGYQAWAHHQQNIGYERSVAEYQAQAVKVDAKREAVAAPIEAEHQAAVVRIRTVTQTILKEVPVYVKNSDCPAGLSGGFRVLHDADANGEVPDTARIPDAAPVAVDTVANTIAINYGAAHENARQLIGLQQWIKEQQALTQ